MLCLVFFIIVFFIFNFLVSLSSLYSAQIEGDADGWSPVILFFIDFVVPLYLIKRETLETRPSRDIDS